mgnify:CR=1 FL=1
MIVLNKLLASEILVKKLDKITWKKIILLGLTIFILMGHIFYFCLIVPMDQRITELKGQIDSLNLEIGALEQKKALYSYVPNTKDLPDNLYNFRTLFEQNSVDVKEIITNLLPNSNDSQLNQMAVKIIIYGEKDEIITALLSTTGIDNNTFLIEDLDIEDLKAIVNYKMLCKK